MEGRTRYALAVALLVLCAAEPAYAIRERDTDARSDDEGVTVTITIGEDGTPSASGGGGGGDSCEWSVIQYPFTGSDPPARYGTPPSPEHRLYLVFCDGEFVAAQWIDPTAGGGVAVDTTSLARTVVDQVPVDLFGINARPTGEAVTGIPSYFWVEGYDGAPITGSVSNGPVTVDVSINLREVTWDFGDGSTMTGGLGEAWPARSSVRHAYRDRGAYTITVTMVFDAEFSVDGGPAEPLEPIVRTSTLRYGVEEIQAVRHR